MMELIENEDLLQFFKEERIDGAVYDVYIKKVSYYIPDDDDDMEDSSDDNKAHHQWELEEKRVIKAASLDHLVQNLTSSTGEIDSVFFCIFFATYRTFASSKQVLDLLLERYRSISEDAEMKQETKDAYLKTLKTVMSIWMDKYPDDFREPPNFPCLCLIVTFCQRHLLKDNGLEKQANGHIEAFIKENVSSAPTSGELDGASENEPSAPTSGELDGASETEPSAPTSGELDGASETEPSAPTSGELGSLKIDPTVSILSVPVHFELIHADMFAQQLTYVDAKLFKKVIPHHCLGSVWSRRDKCKDKPSSVHATISQFNAVANVVIATIIQSTDLTPMAIARIIIKWIDIAHECRIMKNFSSLKAILGGLQANPIYRLHNVWDQVDRRKMKLFDELSDIFSDDQNQMMIRELLYKEGAAKFADPKSTKMIREIRRQKSMGPQSEPKKTLKGVRRHGSEAADASTKMIPGHQHRKSWTGSRGIRKSATYFDVSQTVHGTVPYLGTFLTDLTMLDSAHPDKTDEGLINFDKKRKEFAILAQIHLLQSAASMYTLTPDAVFFEWFHGVRIYDEKESHELSCVIAPVTPNSPADSKKTHRRKSSLGSLLMQHAGCFSSNLADDLESLTVKDDEDKPLLCVSPASDSCVVKVFLDVADTAVATTCKSIILTNCDHTKTVINNILAEFKVSGQREDYVIAQRLPDKEMMIPEQGNVFYAINTMVPEIIFVMRQKS